MNIKTADGKFVAVSVPASVKRFSELKVGDKVKATYNNNVIVRVKPAGEAAVNTADTSYTKGQKSGTAATVRRMTATVVDIDKSASSISLRAERMEIQPAGRRSESVRSGQGGRQGRHRLEH